MSRIFTTLLLLLLFGIVHADYVNENKAGEAAKNQFWKVTQNYDYDQIIPKLVYTDMADGIAVYYVFEFESNPGFIIIAADDDVYPVLGYSLEKNYTGRMDDQPAGFIEWMQLYEDQIVFARENGLEADEFIASAWENLADYMPKPGKMMSVNPLVNTSWDQGCFYNEYCPEDNDGPCNHVYVGCVATCMAQIMKYYNYPEQGVGTNSYFAYPYGQLTVDFGATTYDWASMPNQLNSNNDAVATLSYHCGVSVNMQYSASGSGAYSNSARDAFVDHFAYSSDAVLYTKNSYSIDIWENMIRNDLNGGFPLYYAGYGSGGHAFVLDGYQGTNHFHFNWGWSGWYNGYFYLNNLNPGGSNFNENQEAIFHIYPEGTVTLAAPENLQYEVVNGNDVTLTWDAPAGKALTGYNIYRNNNNIGSTTETTFTDENLDPGTYEYYVTAVYDEGESVPSGSVSMLISGANNVVFEDDFSDYNSSQQLVCQNAEGWTTWSNDPCSSEDPYVTSEQSYSATNSIIIEGTNDVVKEINNLTSGFYKISFYIYVPDGYLGYFNTLQEFNGANSLWGMQVYFDAGGAGSIDAGAAAAASFNYENDTWLLNEIVIDLNNDWAEYFLEGNSIHSWVWSSGAFGQNSTNQLGGNNFFAWTGSKGTPKFYIDDYRIEDLGGMTLAPPENLDYTFTGSDVELTWDAPESKGFSGYNIYYSFDGGTYELVEFTTETSYLVESPGVGLHTYEVTAVYDEGESQPTDAVSFTITGIEDQTQQECIVYPNPASDVIGIKSNLDIQLLSVYTYDGRLIMSKKPHSGDMRIQVSDFEPGIYIIKIESSENSMIKRIIIK